MNRRKWRVVAVGLVLVVFLGWLTWNTDYMQDRRVWTVFRAQLTEQQVTDMTISYHVTDTHQLSAEEKRQILQWLREADFHASNRVHRGPTVDVILDLQFQNGNHVRFGYWGDGIFETSPRHVDPDAQFLVKSQPLEEWLKQK